MAQQRVAFKVVARGKACGFEALLVEGGQLLLVRALKWKGEEPRLVLQRLPKPGGAEGEFGYHDEGFKDWLDHLQPVNEDHAIQGDGEWPQNLADQWLAHGR